jgi:hypothetical protein
MFELKLLEIAYEINLGITNEKYQIENKRKKTECSVVG